MDDRPKTSRGAPGYSNSPYTRSMGGSGGISTGHRSTEELLRLADAQLKARKSDPSVGGSVSGLPSRGKGSQKSQASLGTIAMSYDANRKVRSSTETYLNNLRRKTSNMDENASDGDEQNNGVSDDDAASTSTSTIGRGGSEFLKQPAKVTSNKSDYSSHKSSRDSRVMSSSEDDSHEATALKKGEQRKTSSKVSQSVKNYADKVQVDLSDKEDENSVTLEALIGKEISVSENSSSLAKKVDEEYDYFDESPPKTPVSGRKEVRFSTQLSIASGEDNISVVESVMDTASIADTPHAVETNSGGFTGGISSVGVSANQRTDSKSSIKTLQSEELEIEINLGIEEILPATVKPDKTPLYDLSSDYDEDLDKLTQSNVFDIDDLVVGDSPNFQSPTNPAVELLPPKSRRTAKSSSRTSPTSRSRRRGSSHGSRSSEQESAEEEILSKSDDDVSTSHSEELMSIGNLHDPQQLESFRVEVAQHKQVARSGSLDYNSADNEENRPASKASLYSQESFDDVSTTEAPYSDFNEESEVGTTDHDKSSHTSGEESNSQNSDENGELSQSENQSGTSEMSNKDLGSQKKIKPSETEVADVDDIPSSFPTYSASEQTSDRKKEKGKDRFVATEKVNVDRRNSEVRTDHRYVIQRETESSIDRVFHQIVTVQPKSVASMVVEKEAIDALTNFNPASVALSSFMRSHLDATRKFIENTRRLHEQYQRTLLPDYHYTTLHDTKQEMRRTKHHSEEISLEEAIDRVERSMGERFSEKKRKKIREKIAQIESLSS